MPRTGLLAVGTFVIAGMLSTAGCESTSALQRDFVDPVQAAHGQAAWDEASAIETGMRLAFGDSPPLEAHLIVETGTARARLDLPDGTRVIHDGRETWLSPPGATFPRARFHILTWPWFLVSPFELGRADADLELHRPLTLRGEEHVTARMTVEAADDWYILYKDPRNDRLKAQAYMMTHGTPVSAADKEPHAILYQDFGKVDGIRLPMRWSFWNWDEERGIYGERIGQVVLKQPRFIEPPEGTFDVPPGARKLPAPPGS